MTTRPKSIDTILLEAVELPTAAERAAYLDRECGDDVELRQELEKLIADHFDAGSFLEHPAARLTESLRQAADRAVADAEPRLDFLAPCEDASALGKLGSYTVNEVIGRGGMGIVLKGHDPRLNRTVAIKVLAPELAGNAAARKRFVREGQAAAAVAHQHVVAVYAVDEEPLPYLVMECIHGQSLQQRIDQKGPLELKEVLRIGTQVAAGLAAAHAHGVIHRDIKPANILLENGIERVRITDFGLARAVDDVAVTRTGELAGTPQYMSPEQAQGQPVDARSDLFNLGCVLYAMCTGRSPFRAETTVGAIRRVCDDTPRPIRQINAEIPEWLVAIIDRLLAKNPTDRFQTAEEVAELLGKHLAHLQDPGSTPPPGMVRPVRSRARGRQRWLVAALVLIAVAASLGVTEATGVTRFTASVISIVRGDGTLIVEVDDPEVSVTIEGDDVVITGAGPREVRLKPGEYQVRSTKDGNPLGTELVTITRGGRRVVRVARAPASSLSDTIDTDGDYTAIPAGSITRVRRLVGHTGAVTDVIPFLDGARCLTSSHDGTVRLWEIPTSRLLHTFRFGDYYGRTPIALAPDQELAAAGTDPKGTIRLFEVETGHLLRQLSGDSDVIAHLEFSPDGRRLLSRNVDKTLRLWDVETGKELHRLDCEPWWSRAAAFSITGNALFYGDRGFTVRWNIATQSETWRVGDDEPGSDVAAVVVSPNGSRVAVCTFGGPIHLRDAETGELLGTFVGHPAQSHSDIAFTPDGRHLLSGNNVDETLRVWSTETFAEICRIKADRAIVNKLAVLPDGRDVITGGGIRHEPLDEWIPEGNYDLHVWRLPESVWPRTDQSQTESATDSEAFVVLRSDGQTTSRFGTLADAVLGSSAGDTIEIRGNGPFVTNPIEIVGRPLVVRPGEGHRPVLRLSAEGARTNRPLLQSDSALVVEGIEFQRLGQATDYVNDDLWPGRAPTLVEGSGSVLKVTNCTFRLSTGPKQVCVYAATDNTSVTVRNCYFACGHTQSYCVSCGSTVNRCVIENCTAIGGHLLAIHEFGVSWNLLSGSRTSSPQHRGIDAAVSRCTVVTPDDLWAMSLTAGLLEHLSTERKSLESPTRVETSQNIFDSRSLLSISITNVTEWDREDSHSLFEQLFAWSDENNLLTSAPRIGMLQLPEGFGSPPSVASIEEWKEFWQEPDATLLSGTVRYQGGDLLSRLRTEPESISPEDFRLRPDSAGYQAGRDGKDLGADVDLVGPGQAYERWKRTPAYREWLEQIQLMTKDARDTSTIAGPSPDYAATPAGSITRIRRLQGHTGMVNGVAFLPDGRQCLSGGGEGTIRIWDLETGKSVRSFDTGHSISQTGLSPDGAFAATGHHDGRILLWNLQTGQVIHELAGHGAPVYQVVFSPDGQRLVSRGYDKTIRVWDVELGSELQRLDCEQATSTAALFAGDRRHILVADETRCGLWNLNPLQEVWVTDVSDRPIYNLALSPDANIAALGSGYGMIYLVEMDQGTTITTFRSGTVSRLRFTRDGRHLVSGGQDGTLRIWSLENSSEIARIEAQTHCTDRIDVSADGRFVLTGGGSYLDPSSNTRIVDDRDLHLWQLPESVWIEQSQTEDMGAPPENAPGTSPRDAIQPDKSGDVTMPD